MQNYFEFEGTRYPVEPDFILAVDKLKTLGFKPHMVEEIIEHHAGKKPDDSEKLYNFYFSNYDSVGYVDTSVMVMDTGNIFIKTGPADFESIINYISMYK